MNLENTIVNARTSLLLYDSIGMTGPESENTIQSKLEVSWLWEMTKVGMTVNR